MATHKQAIKRAAQTDSFRREIWESFAADRTLRERHQITDQEMEALSRLAMLGSILSKQDYVFILSTIRSSKRK